jgi:phenylalanyl-tRNA synthetase beta chain
MAHQGETIKLLNNKTYELNESDIVIADAEGAIGLAGIMGGSNSEVSSKTTNIVLEVGTFDMYAVRRSSMRHGVFTDALTRFNKGQSPLQNDRVIARLMSLLHDLSGAEQASDVFDDSFTEQTDKTSLRGELTIPLGFINDRLGLELTAVQVGNLLRGANFAVFSAGSENILSVTAPFWRTDIELPEDIVEEVGRLYGFDRLPRELPLRSTQPAPRNASRELAETVRRALARAGANEVLTYSFVHARVLEAAGQNPDDAYRLSNALSPDLQYYRLSVTPSLLDKVNANIRAGHNEFSLFEIGKSHSKKAGVDESGLPVEPGRIAFVYAAKKSHEGAPYFHAKKALDFLASEMGLELVYKSLPAGTTLTAAAPFAGGRTARVVDLRSGQAIGIIGEYALSVRKAFKLPDYAAGFELFTEGVMLACGATENQYVPLSRYPSVERDICFAVESSVTYGDVMAHIQKALTATEVSGVAEPADIYQAEGERRRITVRIRITPHDQTMTGEAANACIDTISEYVVQRTGALII